MGGMIGALIWTLGRKSGKDLNIILRIIIGIIFAALVGGVVYFFSNRDESIKIIELIIGALSMGVTFGVLAGVMARAGNS